MLENNVYVAEKNSLKNNTLKAYLDIPYSLIGKELDGGGTYIKREINQILALYDIYNNGANFSSEGSGGDYIPADLRYKKSAKLINKEARFLFGNMPDIIVDLTGDTNENTDYIKDNITNMQNLLNKVFEKNYFENTLLQAAKDCFIGSRVACLVNFNENTGITLRFLKPTQFVYEMSQDTPGELSKFVAFITTKYSQSKIDKRIFKKKYELEYENGEPVVYLEEEMYNGSGELLEVITERQSILLSRIPAVVILNDGLTGDNYGVSEIEELMYAESWYSKLSNGDIDAARKSMHPIRYTVDMNVKSTKNLSSAPGSYWDLHTDQNLDKPAPAVGQLTSSLEYSGSLDTTLKRINTEMHDIVEMPDITLENMSSIITSGKALKAVYWPLIVRCNEKMKAWGPQLKNIAYIIIEGAIKYPNTIKRLSDVAILDVPYEINIKMNYPLPEDEQEEKEMDITEVGSDLMSKKTYMKKWRNLTDAEVEEELKQIAFEKELLESSSGFNDFSIDNNYNNIDDTVQIDDIVQEETKEQIEEENMNE